MTTTRGADVIVVGAGLAGALLATLLARRHGCRVRLFERRPDPRERGFVGGRSINLALSVRGIHALGLLGLDEAVLADGIPMRGRMMHDDRGRLRFQPYSRDPKECIHSVSRGGLNIALLEAAGREPNVSMRFGCRCEDVDVDAATITFAAEADGTTFTESADVIIGADGAFSAVRNAMLRTDRFDYEQSWLAHGYKELEIPPAADGDFALEPNALHIWPRGGSMMIALPNRDRTFTCTLFWPFAGPNGFDAIRTPEQVRRHFERRYPDAVPLMPTLLEDYETNPTSALLTIRCAPWQRNGRVLVLGDAAHAIVPFYGQGMNAAFEDCAVLHRILEECGGDWSVALPRFAAERKPDADAIADLALENFIEMRDKVASPWFLLKKKGGQILHGLLPRFFVPLYNLVSFSRVPYAEARRRARRQRQFVRGVAIGLAALLAIVVIAVVT